MLYIDPFYKGGYDTFILTFYYCHNVADAWSGIRMFVILSKFHCKLVRLAIRHARQWHPYEKIEDTSNRLSTTPERGKTQTMNIGSLWYWYTEDNIVSYSYSSLINLCSPHMASLVSCR